MHNAIATLMFLISFSISSAWAGVMAPKAQIKNISDLQHQGINIFEWNMDPLTGITFRFGLDSNNSYTIQCVTLNQEGCTKGLQGRIDIKSVGGPYGIINCSTDYGSGKNSPYADPQHWCTILYSTYVAIWSVVHIGDYPVIGSIDALGEPQCLSINDSTCLKAVDGLDSITKFNTYSTLSCRILKDKSSELFQQTCRQMHKSFQIKHAKKYSTMMFLKGGAVISPTNLVNWMLDLNSGWLESGDVIMLGGCLSSGPKHSYIFASPGSEETSLNQGSSTICYENPMTFKDKSKSYSPPQTQFIVQKVSGQGGIVHSYDRVHIRSFDKRYLTFDNRSGFFLSKIPQDEMSQFIFSY